MDVGIDEVASIARQHLTRGDRVYDVKVGDTLDGIYQVESATGGQLTFNYKPLNQRQALATGATP